MIERSTLQKSIIYNALTRLGNHPTADEVYELVHTENPSISRATVYRVLNRYAEKGEILKVGVSSGADHYDHRADRHYHVCCIRCGRVDDVDLPYIPDMQERLRDSSGYEITDCTVQFKGICPKCLESEEMFIKK